MSFIDKAKDLVGKIEDKIPESVKDKIPESIKGPLGIDDENDPPAETPERDLTADATEPGSVSDIAGSTSSDAADTVRESSATTYSKAPDGTDEHLSDAPGAGRGSVSDIVEP